MAIFVRPWVIGDGCCRFAYSHKQTQLMLHFSKSKIHTLAANATYLDDVDGVDEGDGDDGGSSGHADLLQESRSGGGGSGEGAGVAGSRKGGVGEAHFDIVIVFEGR